MIKVDVEVAGIRKIMEILRIVNSLFFKGRQSVRKCSRELEVRSCSIVAQVLGDRAKR